MDIEEFRYRVCNTFINEDVKGVCWYTSIGKTPDSTWAYSALTTLCAISKYEITDFTYTRNNIMIKVD